MFFIVIKTMFVLIILSVKHCKKSVIKILYL